MKHAEYVAQGYASLFTVFDVYEDENDMFRVDVHDWSKGLQVQSYTFTHLAEAEAKKAELESEIAEYEVDVDQDDPQQEYKAQAMNELAARGRA